VTLLPIFPLPTVVLFPGVLLPLHIFEPRYRAMVADALEDDRRIGMVLLQPGWEADYEGRPPVFAHGCSGVIVHAVRLDDGRYHMLLRGLDRFRIASEDHERPYRRAVVEWVADPPLDNQQRRELADSRARLVELLGPSHVPALASLPIEEFVHTLAQNLDFEPIEKQALLERENLCLRARSLVELLEMKRLRAGMPPGPDVPH
jgi:Lon protease-like protein